MAREEELRKLAQKRRRTKAADNAALAERNALIYDLRVSGAMTQAAISRVTELTREQIVRILKAEEEKRQQGLR